MISDLFLILLLVSFVCIIVGAVKPALFSRLFRKEITRKKSLLIFGVATLVFFVLFGITAPKTTPQQKVEQRSAVSEQKQEIKTASETAHKPEVKTNDTPAQKATTTPTATPKTTTTPAPTQVQQTPVSTITISQKNAVQKAKSYLGYTAFSHDGLVEQLEYEQFSHADAVYGADNSGANWNEQAAKKAKQYVDYSAFSHGSLVQQLIYDKFTQEQAEYGANAVGL
jgi:cytoskeletal protein RodZ